MNRRCPGGAGPKEAVRLGHNDDWHHHRSDRTVTAGTRGKLAALPQDRTKSATAPHDGLDTKINRANHVMSDIDGCRDMTQWKSDIAYLRQQVHGLRSKLHGELALLALRIEDNERRAMRRRKVARWWTMAAVIAIWLWLAPGAVLGMLTRSFLLPGVLLISMTLLGATILVVLILHNQADEQDHADRYRNWFRVTARDDS